jgi:hypothetical protein
MAESSRPTLSWSKFWDELLVEEWPCDKTLENQGVMRMGVALEKLGVDLSSFTGARCGLHNPGHILHAQELADWLSESDQTKLVGQVKKYDKKKDKISWKNFEGKKGIIFVEKRPGVDHIDLWDGRFLKGVDKLWSEFEQVWFWDLWPCVTKAERGSVKVYSKANVKSRSLISVERNRHVEVVEVVDENWVKVNLTKYYAVEYIGFIERDSLECQPVEPPIAEKKEKKVKWSKEVWDELEEKPCEGGLDDQCAMRVGVALEKLGVDLSSFTGARCGRHTPGHILRAKELADWLSEQTKLVGQVKKYDKASDKITWEHFKGKKGIMFIEKPIITSAINHIDLWDGSQLRKGKNEWISVGRWVYFWEVEQAQK